MKNLITVKNLKVSYGTKKVVENISFNVEEGDFLVIFGENGSGKSSLVKVLLNLKEPSAGEINYHDGLKASQIGYLPQSINAGKDFPASAWEVVLSGCLNGMGLKPFYTKKEKETAKKNMQLLSVYDLKRECFKNLSGGQKQKILLARALCATDRLLLLDEPSSGLDPQAASEFYSAVKKINESGVCIIMVSHDTASSLSVAKHILDIGEHRLLYFGDAQNYR